MRRPLLLALLLLGTAVLAWQQLKPRDMPPLQRTDEERRVEHYLKQAQVMVMDEQGNPARTLSAQEIRQYSDSTRELVEPRLAVYADPIPPWKLQAHQGWVSADGSHLQLMDQVQLLRAAAPGVRPVEMHTEKLEIEPQRDFAYTAEPVRVKSQQDWLEATGMRAWFKAPLHIELLSDVKGYYAPPK